MLLPVPICATTCQGRDKLSAIQGKPYVDLRGIVGSSCGCEQRTARTRDTNPILGCKFKQIFEL